MRTSRSIIEQHRAFDDDVLTGPQAVRYDGLILLLKIDFDGARFERPRGNLDEHLIGLVSEHYRGRRDGRHRLLRGQEGGAGEHIRLQPYVGVLKRYTNLGAARVRIQNVADEENSALENFARIRGEDHLDGLTL